MIRILTCFLSLIICSGAISVLFPEEIESYTLDGTEKVISQQGVGFDSAVSVDGNGSLKITATEPVVINLFETVDIYIENAYLVYSADIKTRGVTGNVYLEMWCVFKDKSEYFSRALDNPFTGTIDWAKQQTPFLLQQGQNPDNVKLNLVINGQGTVWIDNISLLKEPLK